MRPVQRNHKQISEANVEPSYKCGGRGSHCEIASLPEGEYETEEMGQPVEDEPTPTLQQINKTTENSLKVETLSWNEYFERPIRHGRDFIMQ